MAKFAVLFLAALAFQASVAVPRYYEEGTIFNYLDGIKSEVRDLTVFFEKDFPEHPMAIKSVTWQCNKLVEVLEVIINKLREETFVVRGEHKVFGEVIYTLEELVQVLRKVTIYHDMTNLHELKKYFVLTIHTVLEHFEQLVTLTQTYYPEFRYTLKYLLVDFMTALHGIRSHFVHISTGFEVVQAPRHLIKEIHEYTREFTDILKEFNHPTQVKVALRGYLHYVDEVIRKLQDKDILGRKELDIVITHLTNKLREIVLPLKEIMHENIVDMKVFRTEIVTKCLEVVSIFEQLVQLCEDKVLPEELTHFLIKVIYHYWFAVKHVCYEITMGHKVGFYKPEYYNTEFFSKYGYGLYEKAFHGRFMTPYHYETSMHHIPMNWMTVERDIYSPYRYETLFPVRRFTTGHFYGNSFNWNKYGLNKFYTPMKYQSEFESPIEVVKTIEMLVKRVYEQFQYTTVEVSEMRPMITYTIREFIEILDYILAKFESRVQFERFYADKLVEEFIYRIKEIKMELRQIVNTEVFTNVHEIRMHLIRCIEIVAKDLTKWFVKPEIEQVLVKDICYKFVSFLNKIVYQRESFPVRGSTWFMPRSEPTYYSRWMKY